MIRTIAALFVALTLSPVTAAAETTQSTIAVMGTATVALTADLATISSTIRTNAAIASSALSQNNATYDRIVASLTRLGIARDDIVLSSFSVGYMPRPETVQPSDNTAYGFNVSRSFTVKVRHIPQAGAAIDACVSNGSTQIDGVSFDASDTGAARKKALQLATQDAFEQAQIAAAASHQRVVRPLTISTYGSPVAPDPRMLRVSADTYSTPGRPTLLDSGAVTLSETVNASYLTAPL